MTLKQKAIIQKEYMAAIINRSNANSDLHLAYGCRRIGQTLEDFPLQFNTYKIACERLEIARTAIRQAMGFKE